MLIIKTTSGSEKLATDHVNALLRALHLAARMDAEHLPTYTWAVANAARLVRLLKESEPC